MRYEHVCIPLSSLLTLLDFKHRIDHLYQLIVSSFLTDIEYEYERMELIRVLVLDNLLKRFLHLLGLLTRTWIDKEKRVVMGEEVNNFKLHVIRVFHCIALVI